MKGFTKIISLVAASTLLFSGCGNISAKADKPQTKDKDGIDKVVSEYTMKYLNKQKLRSSVLAKLDKCKEAVKAMAQKAVEKRKERAR